MMTVQKYSVIYTNYQIINNYNNLSLMSTSIIIYIQLNYALANIHVEY